MCWWSTGIEHANAPTIAAIRGAHIPAAFTTVSASLATVPGANAANKLAIEAFSTSDYTGTIYVDEIDLR